MKPFYLLDTNVISELSKPEPNMYLLRSMREKERHCAICSTVWQEAVLGCELIPEGRKKKQLEIYLQKIKETYDIIPYDSFSAQIFGELRTRCQRAGTPAPFSDTQIAATAIAHNMILITHNTADFAPISAVSMLRYEDWWK